MNSGFSGMRGKIAAVALAACASAFVPSAQASILYDLAGVCEIDCSRFGVADGTAFSFSNALGLADGTDTSAGTRAVVIDFLTLFSIEFGPTTSTPPFGMTFSADNVIGSFVTDPVIGSGNVFCFNSTGSACDGGRFDTVVTGFGAAAGDEGHGPLTITAAPEPASVALLGLGLAGIAGIRRRRLQDANR